MTNGELKGTASSGMWTTRAPSKTAAITNVRAIAERAGHRVTGADATPFPEGVQDYGVNWKVRIYWDDAK